MKMKKINNIICIVIDELNEQFSEQKLTKTPETVLFGQGGKLTSLELVNLIVATEQKLEEEFGISITLADEKAMSQKNSPFRTIGTLSEYISTLL